MTRPTDDELIAAIAALSPSARQASLEALEHLADDPLTPDLNRDGCRELAALTRAVIDAAPVRRRTRRGGRRPAEATRTTERTTPCR